MEIQKLKKFEVVGNLAVALTKRVASNFDFRITRKYFMVDDRE